MNGSARTVRFADGDSVDAHTVILATGVAYRQLTAPGLDELTGRGVYYGSALTEAANCADQDVYIVGGANSAGQAAVYLARRRAVGDPAGARASRWTTSMSYYLIQQIAAIDNITVRTCTEVVEAHGDEHLEQLTLRDNDHRRDRDGRRRLRCSCSSAPRRAPTGSTAWWCATRGASCWPARTSPSTAARPPGWILDRSPFHLETSVPGVFVAGDVRAESAKRVASAVGEGAMAVMLVHRYLEG